MGDALRVSSSRRFDRARLFEAYALMDEGLAAYQKADPEAAARRLRPRAGPRPRVREACRNGSRVPCLRAKAENARPRSAPWRPCAKRCAPIPRGRALGKPNRSSSSSKRWTAPTTASWTKARCAARSSSTPGNAEAKDALLRLEAETEARSGRLAWYLGALRSRHYSPWAAWRPRSPMGAARLVRVESRVVPADPVIFVESTRATTVPWIRAQFVMNAIEAAFPGNTAREVADAVGLHAPNGTEPPITLAQLDALYEEGARRTGDEAFGLHLAEHSDPRMFDLLGYALMNGKNLADSFEKLRPYLRTIHGNEELMLVVDGERARFAYRVTDSRARPSRHRSEAYLGIVFKMAKVALGREIPPVAVTFEHSAPQNISEHRRFFGTQVFFDCPVNELVFASELLEEPIANADPGAGGFARPLHQRALRGRAEGRPHDLGGRGTAPHLRVVSRRQITARAPSPSVST